MRSIIRKYYISGPMTGIENKNLEEFVRVEAVIRKELQTNSKWDFDVVNPATLDIEGDDPTWEEFMKNDIIHLMDCDYIVMMDGWEKSTGATIEYELAKNLGIVILDLDLNPFTKAPEGILEEAENLTNGSRQASYGHPSENFKNIADGWNWYIDMKYKTDSRLTPEDIALMMTILKLARETHAVKRDNIVDAAGYLNTYQMCIDKNEEKILTWLNGKTEVSTDRYENSEFKEGYLTFRTEGVKVSPMRYDWRVGGTLDNFDTGAMTPSENGDWVLWDDIQTLK